MIRFLRNLILTVIIVAIAGFIALLVLGNYFIDRAEGPLTAKLIGVFGPGDEDDFGYTGGLKFVPFRITVKDLYIDADALRVGGVIFSDSRIDVESVECDALKIIRENEVVINTAHGRSFAGHLTDETIKEWLLATNENMRDLDVEWHRDDECWITGRFGLVSAAPMTVIGVWGVDDRGVATLLNREYHNPDSPVPAGMIDMLDEQISFDIRISIFNEELKSTGATYDRDGLTITASESE